MLTFEDWMRYRGLSPSSVKKYDGAIRGVMSEWAMDNGLVSGLLTTLSNRSSFEVVAAKIRALPVYQERNERGHNMYNSALTKFSEYLGEWCEGIVESDIDAILAVTNISETEKSCLVKARIGQGDFRRKLIDYWGGCAVTGFKGINMLLASHIKPWHASTNEERLDPFNGLLLVPNLDKAFDAGYITFASNGCIQISPLLIEAGQLGISPQMRISLTSQHEPFMKFHRAEIFRAE